MKKVSWGDRLRYAFDNYMGKGTAALVGGLALITIVLVLGLSLVVWGFKLDTEMNFAEILWTNLLQALAPNPVDVHAGPWAFLLTMLITTLGGIFVVSIFIGVLTTGIENRIDSLRKGRSRVIENGHVIILGWSAQIFTIISELSIANGKKGGAIVILGEKDKVEMEEEIREKVGPTGKTHVVCRTGNPMELTDLDIVSLNTSRAVIIISPDNDDPDSSVIKAMLAITNHPRRRTSPYHIVAEIRDPKNVEVARLVGKDEVELVLVSDLVARVIAQTCRQSGLSVVYTELLNFDGDEIYFGEFPALTGVALGEALFAFEDSAVIGLKPQSGAPRLNPPLDTVIQPGDQLIGVTEEQATFILNAKPGYTIDQAAIRSDPFLPPRAERTLMLGWNWRAPAIINQLEQYVAPGSELMIVAERDDLEAHMAQECQSLANLSIHCQNGDTTDRRLLESLHIEDFRYVIILCYSDSLPLQQADARTLVTLLHLRDMADRGGFKFSITSEMLDIHNRNLAEIAHADDFIVSDKLVSLMMAQVAENKDLNAIFTDIFDPEGSEIYLKPAAYYVGLGQPVNFYTVVEAARRRGEIAIGYRLRAWAADASKGYGVTVNPDKSEMVTFTEYDRVVVVAES